MWDKHKAKSILFRKYWKDLKVLIKLISKNCKKSSIEYSKKAKFITERIPTNRNRTKLKRNTVK